MSNLKKHGFTIAGVILTATAIMLSASSDPAVPNDPNIGAGLLFLVGGGLTVAGLSKSWTRWRTR